MADRIELDRLLSFGKKIELEVPEIACETSTSILIEWNRQNAWFQKKKVRIEQRENSVVVTMPKWLFERKFS